jgi:hypothetical protein
MTGRRPRLLIGHDSSRRCPSADWRSARHGSELRDVRAGEGNRNLMTSAEGVSQHCRMRADLRIVLAPHGSEITAGGFG